MKNIYIFWNNGVVLVRAGDEAILALRAIADDAVTALNKLKDQWDQGDLLIKELQAVFDAAARSDRTLESVTAVGSVAFGIGLGLAIGGTGVVAVAGGLVVGYIGDLLYKKAVESAKITGRIVGSVAFELWGPKVEINENYLGARSWLPPRDPLVLDLDGDGIETVGISGNTPILFDHDADGTRTGTGWIKPDDGLLVLDRNGNGTIDSGRELFGDET